LIHPAVRDLFLDLAKHPSFQDALHRLAAGGNASLSADAPSGDMDSNIRNIVSILVFMAPICRSRSAMLLVPAGFTGEYSRFGEICRGPPKQSLQYTGLTPFGRKGTWHGLPHLLQTASNFLDASWRNSPGRPGFVLGLLP